MKKMFFIIMYFFAFESASFAIIVDWQALQHRKLENGDEFNRISFALFDDDHNYLTEDLLSSVTLYDPDGISINLSDINGKKYEFRRTETLYGNYNGNTGQWIYGEFAVEYYYVSNFPDPLKIGTYKLTVNFLKGEPVTTERQFTGPLADIPVISSDSFYLRKDNENNIIWKWSVPDSINNNLNLQTSVRASVNMYKNEVYLGELYVTVPTHLGYLFVPSNVYQKIEAKSAELGADLRIGLHLRTADNLNRTYSDNIPLNQADKVKLDINNDGKTGLEEAIHVLKVVSDIKK